MAKASKKRQETDKQLTALLEEELGNAETPEKIDLGDTASLKRALDDEITKTLEGAGCSINYILTDSKIALGIASCVVAAIAQLWPGKYPSTSWVLIPCIIIYTILSAALAYLHLFIEKDTLHLLKPQTGQPAFIVRTTLPRFDDAYTLAIRPDGTSPNSSDEVKILHSIGRYFDTEGILATNIFKSDVLKLLQHAKSHHQEKSD